MCRQAAERLDECGLLSDGEFYCGSVLDPWTECYFRECFLDATCSALETLVCTDAADDPPSCLEACQSFTCDDGSLIPDAWSCDDYPDCPDGEDEVGCPSCDDGIPFPQSWRCDGAVDCEDQSDEAGCSYPTFDCDDGFFIHAGFVCDGSEDCTSGADEAACPESAELICSE